MSDCVGCSKGADCKCARIQQMVCLLLFMCPSQEEVIPLTLSLCTAKQAGGRVISSSQGHTDTMTAFLFLVL